jgi:hypothetical protein
LVLQSDKRMHQTVLHVGCLTFVYLWPALADTACNKTYFRHVILAVLSDITVTCYQVTEWVVCCHVLPQLVCDRRRNLGSCAWALHRPPRSRRQCWMCQAPWTS